MAPILPCCPRCGSCRLIRYGIVAGKQRWRCRRCRYQFTRLEGHGTPEPTKRVAVSLYGSRMPAFRAIDHHVYDRMRNFLARRHKVEGRGTRRFSSKFIFGELGVLWLRRDHFGPRPTALR